MNHLLSYLSEWVKQAPPGSRRESRVRVDSAQLEFDLVQFAGAKETHSQRAIGWVELNIDKHPRELLRWHFTYAVKVNKKQWAEETQS